MDGMTSGGGMGNAGGSMSDVLRIQLEMNELENREQSVQSDLDVAKVRFNALLNRPSESEIFLPDTLAMSDFAWKEADMRERIRSQNSMLRMIDAEKAAGEAMMKMNKKMSLPMIGVGLQYMWVGKRSETSMSDMSGMGRRGMSDMNGMDMVMPMLSVSVPIFRKKYSAQQREDRLKIQASQEKYEGALNDLEAEYAEVCRRLRDAERQVALYREQDALAMTTYRLAVQEYVSGSGALNNVLEVRRQWLDYRFKRAEAVAAYNTAVAMMENLLSESQEP
ncbi:MAG: TolC family protein [Paraprevotella sp.]|nr:TolC family protein [Paraprevotella sp.]